MPQALIVISIANMILNSLIIFLKKWEISMVGFLINYILSIIILIIFTFF